MNNQVKKSNSDSLMAVPLFHFNPNTTNDEDWKKLGLSDKQVKTIRKYIDRGGRFRIRSDLSKMYCLREEEYLRLYPYIDLPETVAGAEPDAAPRELSLPFPYSSGMGYAEKVSPQYLEINTADSASLVKLKGIGPWLASKIIRYRDKLGGFYDIQQLLEVYRMTTGKLDSISPFLRIDTTMVRKLAINYLTEEELGRHPYLSRSQCGAIVAYREKHGLFRHAFDLLNTVAVDEKTYKKIRFYLDVR